MIAAQGRLRIRNQNGPVLVMATIRKERQRPRSKTCLLRLNLIHQLAILVFQFLILLDELARFFKQLRSTSVTLVCVVWLKCRSLGVRDLEVSLGDQQCQKQLQYRRTVVTFTDASSYLHCDRAPNQFRANQSE